MRTIACVLFVSGLGLGQVLPPLPAPMGIPKPGPVTDGPYAPQTILPGGVVIPLYPAGNPLLKAEKVREAEVYNMSAVVPGRISSIVNIHNPSIEVHVVERGINTGAVVILAAGGGHRTLNVGGESADFVPYFYNFGGFFTYSATSRAALVSAPIFSRKPRSRNHSINRVCQVPNGIPSRSAIPPPCTPFPYRCISIFGTLFINIAL